MGALDGAPESAAPIDAVATALDAAAAAFEGHREHSQRRQKIIAANAELRERELIKLASLSAALADALRRRGVADPAASLAAEAGIAVFKIAFERWVDETEPAAGGAAHQRVTRRAEGRDGGQIVTGRRVRVPELPHKQAQLRLKSPGCAQPRIKDFLSQEEDNGTFLRGGQLTDENGQCGITSIWPGHCISRTVHVHAGSGVSDGYAATLTVGVDSSA